MKPTEKLQRLLEAEGFTNIRLRLARGYWSHVKQDCYRWEAYATGPQGISCWLHSWDTVTECTRGVVITHIYSYEIEVSAKTS